MQIILKGVILVDNKRDQMKMPIGLAAAAQVLDIRFDDGLGVDPHALGVPPESADQRIEALVKSGKPFMVRQPDPYLLRTYVPIPIRE